MGKEGNNVAPPGSVPEAGSIVWLEFNRESGREQAGHRPALVVTGSSYNSKIGLMLCCPMTTQIKGYPFEVRIGGARPSVALADQVKSLDWAARGAVHKGKVALAELAEVRAKINALIGK